MMLVATGRILIQMVHFGQRTIAIAVTEAFGHVFIQILMEQVLGER